MRNGVFASVMVAVAAAMGVPAMAQANRNIMITGFWPPTNGMVRQFSTNPAQNPGGWAGEDWEGRGYNIHSFFPEFPSGSVGQPGVGEMQVDYQAVSADFWRIAAEINPVAIITFSWTSGRTQYGRKDWELEARHRNRTSWTNDYIAPFQPTPSPPDPTMAANALRFSTLPMGEIRDAVNAGGVGPQSYIDDFSTTLGGSFVSEYTGYHGTWYQSLHADPSDPFWCVAAGHIHVGSAVTLAEGTLATEITLRTLTGWLDTQVPGPGGLVVVAMAGVLGVGRRRRGVRVG